MGLLRQGLVFIISFLFVTSCDNHSYDNFEYCIESILEHEGGLSQDKRDPGGTTQWGISLRWLKSEGIDVDGDGDVDEDDVIALTQLTSKELYKQYWWDRYQYYRFKNKDVAAKVFDLAVNMGPKAAHKILQTAINTKVDGNLSNQTFKDANAIDSVQLRQRLREGAKKRYLAIIAHNPVMEVYKTGWLRRAAW